jgi:hypothetical protein
MIKKQVFASNSLLMELKKIITDCEIMKEDDNLWYLIH